VTRPGEYSFHVRPNELDFAIYRRLSFNILCGLTIASYGHLWLSSGNQCNNCQVLWLLCCCIFIRRNRGFNYVEPSTNEAPGSSMEMGVLISWLVARWEHLDAGNRRG